jgi:hypothetical protein
MKIEDKIQEIAQFCETETQNIIAQLQANREASGGAFNGHELWADNNPKVINAKGFDQPLYDTGELMHELQTPSNWELNPKFSGNTLTLSVPDTETFTDSKYDVLDSGGEVEPYTDQRSGKRVHIHSVPARPFKDISAQDMDWIKEQLVEAIKSRYAS